MTCRKDTIEQLWWESCFYHISGLEQEASDTVEEIPCQAAQHSHTSRFIPAECKIEKNQEKKYFQKQIFLVLRMNVDEDKQTRNDKITEKR